MPWSGPPRCSGGAALITFVLAPHFEFAVGTEAKGIRKPRRDCCFLADDNLGCHREKVPWPCANTNSAPVKTWLGLNPCTRWSERLPSALTMNTVANGAGDGAGQQSASKPRNYITARPGRHAAYKHVYAYVTHV